MKTKDFVIILKSLVNSKVDFNVAFTSTPKIKTVIKA